jgi:hypothetical protein
LLTNRNPISISLRAAILHLVAPMRALVVLENLKVSNRTNCTFPVLPISLSSSQGGGGGLVRNIPSRCAEKEK